MLKLMPFSQAIEYFRMKHVLPDERFQALASEVGEKAHSMAFTVKSMVREDVLTDLYGEVQKAIEKGQSFWDFRQGIDAIMEKRGWKGLSPYRLDNIFRTNVQSAYAVGRYRQMQEIGDRRPYWQYDAVNDSRTRPSHLAQDGKVYHKDHPFWNTWYPPNGYRCFPPWVMVLTRSGWKEIHRILPDDRVIGGSGDEQRVTAVHKNAFNGQLIRLVFEDGRIDATPNHRILTMRGWVRADELQRGDVLVETVPLAPVDSLVGNEHMADVDAPALAQRSVGELLGNVKPAEQIGDGAPLDRFQSLDGFRAWAGSHGNLRQVTLVEKKPYNGIVVNLSVETDESYIVQGATVHNCRCRVVSLSREEMEQEGLEEEKKGTDLKPDEGFNYNPGKAFWGEGIAKSAIDQAAAAAGLKWESLSKKNPADFGRPEKIPYAEMPESLDKRYSDYLRAGLSEKEAREAVLGNFRKAIGGEAARLTDAAGDPLILSDYLFKHLNMDGREAYFPLLRPVAEKPFEIWLTPEIALQTGRLRMMKRYIRFYEDAKKRHVMLVADSQKGILTGYTFLRGDNPEYFGRYRKGELLYGE